MYEILKTFIPTGSLQCYSLLLLYYGQINDDDDDDDDICCILQGADMKAEAASICYFEPGCLETRVLLLTICTVDTFWTSSALLLLLIMPVALPVHCDKCYRSKLAGFASDNFRFRSRKPHCY